MYTLLSKSVFANTDKLICIWNYWWHPGLGLQETLQEDDLHHGPWPEDGSAERPQRRVGDVDPAGGRHHLHPRHLQPPGRSHLPRLQLRAMFQLLASGGGNGAAGVYSAGSKARTLCSSKWRFIYILSTKLDFCDNKRPDELFTPLLLCIIRSLQDSRNQNIYFQPDSQ